MANLSDIRTKVLRRVVDAGSAVEAEVDDLINLAMREIQNRHNFRFMEASESYTTTLATRSLGNLPERFKSWRGTPWGTMEDSGREWWVNTIERQEEVYSHFSDLDEGPPSLILQVVPEDGLDGATTLSVWPLSDGLSDYDDGEYRITVPFWRFLPDLEDDGDSNWLTDNAEEYLLFRATAEAFDIDWDDEKLTKYLTKSEAKAREVIKLDKHNRVASLDTWVPVWQGVNGPGSFRR